MTDPEEPRAGASAGRQITAAVALIVLTAAAFWLIGRATRDGVVIGPTASPTSTLEPTSDPTGSIEPTVTPSVTASPSPTEPGLPDGISAQVLDAIHDDSGVGATDAADRLEAAGVEIIAENKAVRVYELTTIFYSTGREADAQAVADFLGVGVVEAAPDTLTAAVDVHVVVGQDYPDPSGSPEPSESGSTTEPTPTEPTATAT